MASVMFRHEVPFGHRLMFHAGKCRYPHGHNYIFEIRLERMDLDENGFVVDFSKLKSVARDFFEQFDHATVLHKDDPYLDVLERSGHPLKFVVLDAHPTAENLAGIVKSTVERVFTVQDGFKVTVTCWEQRDCEASVTDVAAPAHIVRAGTRG